MEEDWKEAPILGAPLSFAPSVGPVSEGRLRDAPPRLRQGGRR